MSNPLNTNSITFYLRFNSLSQTNWYQISEPIGFDGAKFVIEQDPKRFARSVKYGAIDKLKFPNEKGEKIASLQVINPQGDVSDYLDYGFEWLAHIYSIYGFESDVDFLIKINNVDFQVYGLNFKDKDITDRYTYFQCNLIDNSKVADYKRRMDDTLNAFSDKGVFQQTVTPIQTFNYLRRATTLLNKSKWILSDSSFIAVRGFFFNPTRQLESYEIKNSLVNYDFANYLTGSSPTDVWGTADTQGAVYGSCPAGEGLRLIKATKKTNINNIKLNINWNISEYFTTIPPNGQSFRLRFTLIACYPDEINGIFASPSFLTLPSVTTVMSTNSGSTIVLSNYNITQNINMPLNINLNVGQVLYGYFSQNGNVTQYAINASVSELELSASQTSTDVVIKAVRYSDLLKQGNKMVHNLPFNATKFDVNGQFYDQAVFNKRMVSQKTDFLYFKNKDIFESTEEVCADVEISENEIYIGQYEDYYSNDEIGVFSVIPEETTNFDTNERFACNKFTNNYEKFAQDRDLINTSLSTHTESEWNIQNRKVENSKEIKNSLVRDPMYAQDVVDLESKKPTTSTESDNVLCIEDMIPLAPNSFGIIYASLLVRVVDGKIQILNTDSEGTESDINWSLIGISVGSNVTLLNSGLATGNYTVSSFTNSVLILTPLFSLTYFNPENASITIKYYYSNVLWQTRRREGFSLVDGVGASFANLRYTIKRNMFYWYKYLATAVMYSKKDIINSFFKSNGTLKTQLTTEIAPVIENATILYTDLPTPILTGNIINLTVVADYSDVLAYMQLYETKKGFVRCLDLKGNVIKGYVQKSEFTLSSNQLNLVLEEKYEPQILTLTYANGILTVNDVNYNLSGVSNWWKTQNDFIQFFDNKNKPICNLYSYNFISLNGVTYSSISDLVTALNSLV